MPVPARRMGSAISDKAVDQFASLRTYPTLETWMNPLTRRIARHFSNQASQKTLDEIDFDYRLTDFDIGDVACVKYETRSTTPNDQVIVYVHGGGFVAGSARDNAATILPVCELSGVEAIGIDYTLLPEGRYPTQIDEIDAVYKSLLESGEKSKIFLHGDGAGATLILANLMRWRDQDAPPPAGAIFVSPITDGAGISDTQKTLDGHDPLIRAYGGKTSRKLFQYYAPGSKLKDPKISPIYGDFSNLPPMLAQAGTREVTLGETARLIENARRAGVDATLQVFDGMYHLFHMNWSLDEAKHAQQAIADFVIAQL